MATDIGKLYAIIGADTSQFNKKMTAVGKKIGKVGKKMTTMLTLPILALGVAAVKAGADFEYAMTNAWAVTGEGEEALVAMTAKAREMGATTIFSARQAADAMYYMASAGWDSKKMADAIRPALDLAAATQSDLAFATEAVISSMNQFQISTKNTQRVTDVFANAIMNSQATLEKLKISMSFIGPMAHALGYEIEETTGALMGLYNAGYEASTAGTALRMALAKLTEGSSRTKEGLASLGLSLEDVNPEIHSMADIIKLLEERSASATDVIKIFGVRSGPAMAALIAQGSKALDENIEKTRKVGSGAEMAEKQIKTFKGSFKLLTSIINEASIQIFEILGPIIKDLIDNKIRPAIKAFTELTDAKKRTILKIVGLVAALGPALLVLGKMAIILPSLAKGILAIGKAMTFLAKHPAYLVAMAIAAIVVMFIKWRAEQKKVEAMQVEQDMVTKASARHVMKAIELAGMTEEAYIKLRKAHGGNTQELLKAIKAGEHGRQLQIAIYQVLREETKKRKELREEQKKARKEEKKIRESLKMTREEIEAAVIAETKLEEATRKWKERMEELGLMTIPEKKKRIVELTEEMGKLDTMYKDGEITLRDYKEAMEELRTEIMNLTTGLDSEFSPAMISAQAVLIALAVSSRLAKDIIVKDLDDQEVKLETYQEMWNSTVTSMADSLMSFGELSGSIFQNLGKIFSGFVQTFIKGLGKMVIAEMMFAKGTIAAEKMKAVARGIASVFSKIPFPFNIAAAAAVIGTISALFAKIAKFGKGADVWQPTLAIVGEEGPEVVRRRSDYMRELGMARRGGEEGGRPRILHLHQTIKIGEDKIKKKITKIVMEEGEKGNLTLPAKVIR